MLENRCGCPTTVQQTTWMLAESICRNLTKALALKPLRSDVILIKILHLQGFSRNKTIVCQKLSFLLHISLLFLPELINYVGTHRAIYKVIKKFRGKFSKQMRSQKLNHLQDQSERCMTFKFFLRKFQRRFIISKLSVFPSYAETLELFEAKSALGLCFFMANYPDRILFYGWGF